ncbi:MAG: SagB/ThcOx family dehydrogenase [Planctomycetes bacterium]|nr:SagB/ThcOx family dehydrogenase [Planctomycetota bacterium]
MPSSAEHYHQATKYDPATIGNHPGMDWSAKPTLHKEYANAQEFGVDDLSLGEHLETELPRPKAQRARLMRLLYCSYGITAMLESNDGESHALRSAPSAGGLYPCELYVLLRDGFDIPKGLYNYHAGRNVLQLVRAIEDDAVFDALWTALPRGAAEFSADFIVFVSTVFYRSSWRYLERGYRRCLLDSGHLVGNLLVAADADELELLPLSGFLDELVNDLLGLSEKDEGVLAVLLGSFSNAEASPKVSRALKGSTLAPSFEPSPEDLLQAMVQETGLKRADFAMARVSSPPSATHTGFDKNYAFGKAYTSEAETDLSQRIVQAMLARRSGRRYTGEPITFMQLMNMLRFAYQRCDACFAPDLLHSYLVVHNVQGLAQGLYAYSDADHTLYLIEEGDFRNQLMHLSLGQQIAALSSCVLIHTVDLAQAVQRFGNRAYRTIHLDAGAIGQRLAIGANAQGFTTCGIGGFFDDDVNRLLTIRENHICAYLTTIGRE